VQHFNINNLSTFLTDNDYVLLVILRKKDITSRNSINQIVFVMEKHCIFLEVGTEFLNIIFINIYLMQPFRRNFLRIKFAELEPLTTVARKSTMFWNVTPA
jgi:hypothetical protein